jgi:hypothetical protein
MKVLDKMTPCQCGHPLWCHATYVRNLEFDELETTPEIEPYLLGEPGECDHIGPSGWDCDCLVFVIHSIFSADGDV